MQDFVPNPEDGWTCDTGDIAFMSLIGPVWHRLRADGVYEYGFTAQEDKHANLMGRLHGGMISAFADYALGHSCRLDRDNTPNVTVHLGIDYLAGGLMGQWITCEVHITHKTRAMSFIRGEMFGDGQLMATANGVFKAVNLPWKARNQP